MALTGKEERMLEALTKKKDQPDAPPTGKSVNFSVDLGDDKQVERAEKLGLLEWLTGDDDDDDSDDDDDDNEDAPRRRGYFDKEKDK